MIDEKIVRNVAKLARIELTDEEVSRFAGQLDKVFDYMEVLSELDTEGVKELSQVTGLNNVMEEDEVLVSQSDPSGLLGATEFPIDSNQIQVMNVLK